MKKIISLFIVVLCSVNVFAQTKNGVEKLIEVENSFARAAAEKGIKPAFLEFLADDGVMYNPDIINGKEMWTNRPASPALLSWFPTFADISSDGKMGYTTGPGEYRPKGKDDTTVYYTEYMAVWQKQPDGNFKMVLDMGISRPKQTITDKSWKSPAVVSVKASSKKTAVTTATQKFFELAERDGLSKAYKMSAADDIRLLRDEESPILGKNAALLRVKKDNDKGAIKYADKMVFAESGDMAYLRNAYTITKDNKVTERGNFAQIWKFRNGKWQLVLDMFSPLPLEQK